MAIKSRLLFFCLVGARSAVGVSAPTVLPIQDVQVLPNITDSFMWGIRAQVGTPTQDLMVLPWPELNDTWLYDQVYLCDSSIIWDSTICQVRRGNYFYESNSTTFNKASDIVAAGGTTETYSTGAELGIANLVATGVGGTDVFSLGSMTSLSGYPIGIPRINWDHGYTIPHALGLGANSTYLNSLVQAGQIPSRVWSIFWGRMWVSDTINGSVVLGGYDQDKIIGKNYTQALDYSNTTGCWTGMKLTIANLEVVSQTGTIQSILPSDLTSFDVCIVPQRQLLIEAPGAILNAFESATSTSNLGLSYGLHWFTGNMIITFSTGLAITVLNDQMMVPYVDIARNGSRYFNSSIREFLLNPLGTQPPTLGRYFLTAAYLMVDHDANTFTLWEANPTRSSSLVAVVNSGTTSNSSATASVPTAASSSTATSTATSGSGSLPTATVAGAVTGGVLALAVLCLAIVCLIRRRRRKPRPVAEAELPSNGPVELGHDPKAWPQNPNPAVVGELGGAHMTHEVLGTVPGDLVHEMEGHVPG